MANRGSLKPYSLLAVHHSLQLNAACSTIERHCTPARIRGTSLHKFGNARVSRRAFRIPRRSFGKRSRRPEAARPRCRVMPCSGVTGCLRWRCRRRRNRGSSGCIGTASRHRSRSSRHPRTCCRSARSHSRHGWWPRNPRVVGTGGLGASAGSGSCVPRLSSGVRLTTVWDHNAQFRGSILQQRTVIDAPHFSAAIGGAGRCPPRGRCFAALSVPAPCGC